MQDKNTEVMKDQTEESTTPSAPEAQPEEGINGAPDESAGGPPYVVRDLDLSGLTPPIGVVEFNRLAASIRDGGYDPVVTTWKEKGIVIGALHSFIACEQQDLDFRIERVSLPDWPAAQAWVIRNQLKRTDLSEWHRSELAVRLLRLLEAEAEEQTPAGEGLLHDGDSEDIDFLSIAASESGVEPDLIQRAAFVIDYAEAAQLDLLDHGATTVDAVYRTIKDLEERHLVPNGDSDALFMATRRRSEAVLQNECQRFAEYLRWFRRAYDYGVVQLDPAHEAELTGALREARKAIGAVLELWGC